MSTGETMTPPRAAGEVEMVEPEVVRQMRALSALGWGSKRIAAELDVARNTVRRYLRGGAAAEVQTRPRARRLDGDARAQARQLFASTAEGNAVVVQQELRTRGVEASVRTVQRAVQHEREQQRAAEVATVRFETAPGHQMQVDFGQKRVRIGGAEVMVHLLVAVLSYSRRIFVRAFLAERGDDWREGIAAAFRHFGGVPRTLLIDNARPLVLRRAEGRVVLQPAFEAFCRDWDVRPVACAPYRARTKGKGESGVKYVKRNGLAGRDFEHAAALDAHLEQWTHEADRRVHGTTRMRPIDRFLRDEASALRGLPERPLPSRHQRLRRRVGADALVQVDTVRYSVPHRFVRDMVEVQVGDDVVRIFHGAAVIATHRRSSAPHDLVVDPAHYDGLIRRPSAVEPGATPPESFGRTLDAYAEVLGSQEAWS
jgi:transposase